MKASLHGFGMMRQSLKDYQWNVGKERI